MTRVRGHSEALTAQKFQKRFRLESYCGPEGTCVFKSDFSGVSPASYSKIKTSIRVIHFDGASKRRIL